MPLYTNTKSIYAGNEFLKIAPHATDIPSIFFYNIPNLTVTDTEPYYNPVVFKDIFTFTGGETHLITLPENAMNQDDFLFIQVMSNKESLSSVSVTFNSPTNLPSMPLNNSAFNINNNNRIKRIYFTIADGCIGEITTIVTDKFTISDATMKYDYKPY